MLIFPYVGHRETQAQSFISPHYGNYKQLKDAHYVLDSLHGVQKQYRASIVDTQFNFQFNSFSFV